MRMLATLIVFLSGAANGESPAQIVINARLLSPERQAVLEDAWVTIENGTIAAIGHGPAETTGYDVIDARGGFLIPGLIDSHVHLYHATGLKRQYSTNYQSLYESYMQQQPRSFLYYGFTTVIELNADKETNLRIETAPLHPRLIHCGQGVILSDGFMALELEQDSLENAYPGYLIDHYANGTVAGNADKSRHTPEAVVDNVIQQGGRCIKLYYEEALWWPGGAPDFALPSLAIVRDVVAAAQVRSMPVLLHATTPAGHRFALDAGVDILVHGMWEWPEQAYDAPLPKPAYTKIARAVANSRIAVQPTFSTIRNSASMFDAEFLDDPEWTHAVPGDFLHYLRTGAQQQRDLFLGMFGDELLESSISADKLPDLTRAFVSRYRRLIGDMHASGANLIFATDTAVGGFGWAAPPGLAGFWEMRQWARANISLSALFEALTIGNASAFGLDADSGTIEIGKRADMLILVENPLLDVEAYNTIRTVIVGGNALSRERLSARELVPQ